MDQNRQELIQELEDLEDFMSNTRQRRFIPLSSVGEFYKPVFGVLTHADGEYFENNIEDLIEAKIRTALILKKQTHIFASKISKNEQNVAILKNRMASHHTGAKIQPPNPAYLHLEEISSRLTMIERALDQFRSIVRAAKMGKLYPELLSRATLRQVIAELAKARPDLEFPISEQYASAEKLVEFADVKIGYHHPASCSRSASH